MEIVEEENMFIQQLESVKKRINLTKINSEEIVFNKYYDQTLFIIPNKNSQYKQLREKLYIDGHNQQKYPHHDKILTYQTIDYTPQFSFVDSKKIITEKKTCKSQWKSSINYNCNEQTAYDRLYPQYLSVSKKSCLELSKTH